MSLLEVRNLQTSFFTDAGEVRAVNGVSFTLEKVIREGLRRSADCICFGHTHMPLVTEQSGILLVNPGSLTFPRQAGRRPACAILETDGEGRLRAAVWEL